MSFSDGASVGSLIRWKHTVVDQILDLLVVDLETRQPEGTCWDDLWPGPLSRLLMPELAPERIVIRRNKY